MNRLTLYGVAIALALAVAAAIPAYVHHLESAAEQRGVVTGKAVQAAADQLRADQVRDSSERVNQARLDSLEHVKEDTAAIDEGTFTRIVTRYQDRLVHDTVFRDVVVAGERAVRSCEEGADACRVARANAERDNARLRLTVRERDDTLSARARLAVAIPRSCVAPAAGGALAGVLLDEGIRALARRHQ